MVYNLLEKSWIPILRLDGLFERVGIRVALTEAARIRQLAASNPMDNVALLRFLLAVLLWCKPKLDGQDRARLADVTAGGIPDYWLNAENRLGSPTHPNAVFNLLGEGARFYQDPQRVAVLLNAKQEKWDKAQKKSKANKARKTPRPTGLGNEDFRPIGDLLVEFPTESKIAHLRHVRDREYGLCPACCALGIIRFCTFANAYGGGRYTAAVNGPTPAYVLTIAPTLLASFVANLPTDLGRLDGAPPWSRDEDPKQVDIGPLVVFSWRSRKLWLGDRGKGEETCAYCGQPARLIKHLAFTGNWKSPFATTGTEKKFWGSDPHLILEEARAGDDDDLSEQPGGANPKKPSTLGFPAPTASLTAHARFWRRALLAIGAAPRLAVDGPLGSVCIAGPAANKGLYQDAASVSLRGPLAESVHDLAALSKIAEGLLGALRRATLNPDRQHPNRKAALDALSPSLEANLRDQWDEGNAVRRADAFQQVVQSVVCCTTSGSPLRRREALRKAQEAVRQVMERATRIEAKIGPEDAQPPSGGKKRPPRRSHTERKP